jgi:hypothetical protein
MGESFAIQGYSGSNVMMCYVDGDNIVQQDYIGNRQVVGKTTAAYSELEATTTEYYNKLVELGIIVPPKSPEDTMAEMQRHMDDMASIIAALVNEVKELKDGEKNGSQNNHGGSIKAISVGGHIESGTDGAGNAAGDSKHTGRGKSNGSESGN